MSSGLLPRPRSVTLGEGAFASTDATAITGEADAAALLIARVHRRTGVSLLAAADAPTRQGWAWPAAAIDDAPRFAHRELMLDVARHFFGADVVERLADLATRWDAENLAYRRIDDVPWRRP